LLENFVLSDVGCDHFLDLLAFEEQAETTAYNPGIVRDRCEACNRWRGLHLVYERVRDTREAEAAAEKRAVGLHVGDSGRGRGKDLVDFMAAKGGGEAAGEVEMRLGRLVEAFCLILCVGTFVVLREKLRAVRTVWDSDGMVKTSNCS
jgi:hypothetical protein